MPLGLLFGNFPGSFCTLLGALASPLGNFWWTFAVLGVAFEIFVGLCASWVALEETAMVAFLDKFNTFFVIFLIYFSQCSKILANAVAWLGLGWGWGALRMVRRPCACFAKLFCCPPWFQHLLRTFFKSKRASRSIAETVFFGSFRSMAGAVSQQHFEEN